MKEKRRTKEEKPYGGVKMGSTKAVQLPLTSEGARGDTLQRAVGHRDSGE